MGRGRGKGESYSKVFRELKQIPRTWWIRLLVRASKTRRLLLLLLLLLLLSTRPLFLLPLPFPPYVRYWALPIVVGIVSAGGRVIASLPRKTETFLPPNSRSGDEKGGRSGDDERALTGSELSIEISIT